MLARTDHGHLPSRRHVAGRRGLVHRPTRHRAVLLAPAGDRLAYAEFRIGDYQHELRHPRPPSSAAPGGPGKAGGAIVYWHVDDVQASFGRLLALGATAHEEPVERGPGFVTASVIDPFGKPSRRDVQPALRGCPRGTSA